MHTYELSQWILFFFFYSFVGWVWESCYVSVKKRRWVNRGFMHGPMLPLYGSGALVILVSTIGVRENPVLVFIMGMAGATILEYFTGAVMERLFHVRYWDYSNTKINLNGYICLGASLCWGCFSVLLIRVVHLPVESAVLRIPDTAADVLAFLLTAAAAVDFTQAFNEAMDMKRILVQLEESKEQIRAVQERLKLTTEEMRADIREEIRKRSESWEEQQRSRKEAYLAKLHALREARREQLARMYERAEQIVQEEIPAKLEKMSGKLQMEELENMKKTIRREFEKMSSRTDRNYLRAAGILRRNPTAASVKFKEALEELRRLADDRKD